MKCERHPEEEAVGLCMACGRGVCRACRVLLRGVVHCPACLQAGRLAPVLLAEAQPRPAGTPSRAPFLRGMVGSALLSGGGLLALGVRLLAWAPGASGALPPWAPGVAAAVLALGTLLFASGVLGFRRNYGQVLPLPSAAVLLLASLPYLPYLALGGDGIALPGPLPLAATILWGSSWALVGGNFLILPRFLPREGELLTATGVFWIVGGSLLASFVGDLLGIGWIPFAVGSMLSYRSFAVAPLPSPPAGPYPGIPGGLGPAAPPPLAPAAPPPLREGPPLPYPDAPEGPDR